MDRYDTLLLIAMALTVVACPWTKIEEAIGINAVHDILEFGWDLSKVLLLD